MNNKKTKKITIDSLAKMIKEDVVDRMATKEDLENLEKRIDTKMDTRIESINKRIDDFAETKVSKITYKDLEKRVGFIEEKLELKSK